MLHIYTAVTNAATQASPDNNRSIFCSTMREAKQTKISLCINCCLPFTIPCDCQSVHTDNSWYHKNILFGQSGFVPSLCIGLC